MFCFAFNAYAGNGCNNRWNAYPEGQSFEFQKNTSHQVLHYYKNAILGFVWNDVKAENKKELYPIPHKTLENKKIMSLRYMGHIYLLSIKAINDLGCLYEYEKWMTDYSDIDAKEKASKLKELQAELDYLTGFRSVSVDSYLRINEKMKSQTNGLYYLFSGKRSTIERSLFEPFDSFSIYQEVLSHVTYYTEGNDAGKEHSHAKHVVGHLMVHLRNTMDTLAPSKSEIDIFQDNQVKYLAEDLLNKNCPSRKNK